MNKNNNNILKFFFITAGIVLVVIIIGTMTKDNKNRNTVMERGNIKSTANINQKSLKTITASSSINADIDTYLKSSNSMPSSNDFNDSYADLSQ